MKYFKFILASILMFVSTFTFVACGKKDTPLTDEYAENEILVAYFSCTNNTEKVAEYIEDYTDGEDFEITPTKPYTNADLSYNSTTSRTYLEDKDDNARPEIANQIENIQQYKVIFLGYPIWFGKAPKIIYTFLESYDFDGIIIIPFCTSASSGMGSSAEDLHSLAPNAEWKNGLRFESNATKSSVENWLEELNFKNN